MYHINIIFVPFPMKINIFFQLFGMQPIAGDLVLSKRGEDGNIGKNILG